MTDARFELVVYVTPDVEAQVEQRLEAMMDELADITQNVAAIHRHEPERVDP